MKIFGFNITRAKTKPSGTVFRDYSAADTSDLLADFKLDGGWVPGTMAHQLPVMRARARQECKNNPYAKRIVDLYAVNVVGDQGFAFRPLPPFGDGTIDTGAADILKRDFWRWQEAPEYADIAGRLDFRGLCDIAARSIVRDGEAFVRIIVGNYPANPFGFSLQMLNPALCDANLNVSSPGQIAGMTGAVIVNGVELDKWDRPVAYWFADRSKDSTMWTADYLRAFGTYKRIPASEIMHSYTQEVSGQTRGVPGMYSILSRLHMLEGYEMAELVAARADANVVSSYKSQGVADPDALADEVDVLESITKSRPGDVRVAPYGWEIDTHTPSRPNPAMGDFSKNMLRGVASGTGTAYNTLANDLDGVSYSSIRDGKLTERDVYKMAQENMIRDICRRTYREWLRLYLLNPANVLPSEKYNKFATHEWRGRRWPWVDPNSESRYNEMARNYGWKSDATIADEIGEDYDDNLAGIKQTKPKVQGTYLEPKYANETTQPAAARE